VGSPRAIATDVAECISHVRHRYTIREIPASRLPALLPHLKKIASHSKYTRCNDDDILGLDHVFATYWRGTVVGFAGLVCYYGVWSLRICAVLEQHRGNGLQKRLIKSRLRLLRRDYPKATRVIAWVGMDNRFSMNNLRAMGFERVNEKPRTYHGVECVKMRKTV